MIVFAHLYGIWSCQELIGKKYLLSLNWRLGVWMQYECRAENKGPQEVYTNLPQEVKSTKYVEFLRQRLKGL